MKKYLLLGVLALAAGIGAGWVWAYSPTWLGTEQFITDGLAVDATSVPADATTTDAPSLHVVNGERHLFGEMLVGATRSHVFKVENVGATPLTLELEETTCKCTITDLKSRTIAPGETADVRLEWTAETLVPSFAQAATFRTNDPERPHLRLEIQGIVEEAARASPPTLQFTNVPGDETVVRSVRIYASKRAVGMKIQNVEFEAGPLADHATYKLRTLTDKDLAEEPRAVSGEEIIVYLKPGLPTGTLEGNIHVTLNIDEQAKLVVPVVGNVISDISVLGRAAPFDSQRGILHMGPIKQETGRKVELVVLIKGENRDNVELEVAEVTPATALRATLGEKKKTDKLVTVPLTVEVPPGSPLMSHLGLDVAPAGRILLRAQNALTKEIPIEVRFAVTDRGP